MDQYELYEYTNLINGRVKQWGYRVTDTGEIEVRWGPNNRLSHNKRYPASANQKVQETASAKVRKGYRELGRYAVDASGSLVPKPVAPVGRAAIVNQTVPDLTPAPHPRIPAFDLSQIDTEVPDFGFF